MKLNEMRIAITGQTGLVGSTVSSILEEQGHEIVPLFIDWAIRFHQRSYKILNASFIPPMTLVREGLKFF